MNQVIKMTDVEQMTMYMKLSKIELINMLIQANKVIDQFTLVVTYIEQEPICINYEQDAGSTAMNCINCGRGKWEH